MRVMILVTSLVLLLAACSKGTKPPVATSEEISESITTQADPTGRISHVWGPKRTIHAEGFENAYTQLHSYREKGRFHDEVRFFFASKQPPTWIQAEWPGDRTIPMELIDRDLPPNPGTQATQETYRCQVDRALLEEMAGDDDENKVTLQSTGDELVVGFPSTMVRGYLDYLQKHRIGS